MNKPLVLQERIGRHQPGGHLLQVKHPLFARNSFFRRYKECAVQGVFSNRIFRLNTK